MPLAAWWSAKGDMALSVTTSALSTLVGMVAALLLAGHWSSCHSGTATTM